MEYIKAPAVRAHPLRKTVGKVKELRKASDHGKASEPAVQKEQRRSVNRVVSIVLTEVNNAECGAKTCCGNSKQPEVFLCHFNDFIVGEDKVSEQESQEIKSESVAYDNRSIEDLACAVNKCRDKDQHPERRLPAQIPETVFVYLLYEHDNKRE